MPARMILRAPAVAMIVVMLLAAGYAPAAAQGLRCDDRVIARCTEVARIAQSPAAVRAMRFIEQQNATARAELIALTEIPAPPFAEEARARAFADMLRDDLNTAGALGVMFELVRTMNAAIDAGEVASADIAGIREAFDRFDRVLGVVFCLVERTSTLQLQLLLQVLLRQLLLLAGSCEASQRS